MIEPEVELDDGTAEDIPEQRGERRSPLRRDEEVEAGTQGDDVPGRIVHARHLAALRRCSPLIAHTVLREP